MNFFGHSVVAAELRSTSEVVLGSMLPDLEPMVDSAASRFTDPDVLRGITLHHVTDKVFHADPVFLHHQKAARDELAAAPVGRGSRRAAAHVGVELILDAALRTPARLDAYQRALAAGLARAPLAGASYVKRLKLRTLLATLAKRADFVTPVAPNGVVERLERALWSRPALRLEASELPYIEAWANHAWQPIHEASSAWLARLTQAVDAQLADFEVASNRPK